MSDNQYQLTVQQYVREMVALESQIEELLDRRSGEVRDHPGATAAVQRFHTMVKSQRDALQSHLQGSGYDGGAAMLTDAQPAVGVTDTPQQLRSAGASAALQDIYTEFNRAAFGYAMLHARAHRFFERPTADLAEAHLRGYAEAIQTLNQLISEVVVWELSTAGQECQCQCPSCGLGVCVCVPHGVDTVTSAWRETTPTAEQAGVVVRQPRISSAAAQANLREGDIVVAVDDQQVVSYGDLQEAVGAREPGAQIRLRVRQRGGELEELTVTRPASA